MRYFLVLTTFLLNITQLFAQEYAGIGVALAKDPVTKFIYIYQVFPNGPADVAGLQKGDIVGGQHGFNSIGEVSSSLRGKVDLKDKLYIHRNGEEKKVKITRKREETYMNLGCLSGDCHNGIGEYAFPDGSIFKGEFYLGSPFYKEGTLSVSDKFIEADFWPVDTCVGTLTWDDGRKWVGKISEKTWEPAGEGNFYNAVGEDLYGPCIFKDGEFWDYVQKPKEAQGSSTVSFTEAFKELQYNLAPISSGSGDGTYRYADFNKYCHQFIRIFRELENALLAAKKVQHECYDNRLSDREGISLMARCSGKFLKEIEVFGRDYPTAEGSLNSALKILKENSECSPTGNFVLKMEETRKYAQKIDSEAKRLYDKQVQLVNTLNALTTYGDIEKLKKKLLETDDDFRKTLYDVIQPEFKSASEYFDVLVPQIREKCW